MTRHIRGMDRIYPVDRASDQKERKPSTVGKGGIKDEWLKDIPKPRPEQWERMRQYAAAQPDADLLLSMLGLAS